MSVAELMKDSEKAWDREKVRDLFLPFESERILKIRLNRGDDNEQDDWCWDVERDGNYSIKSAYRLLANNDTSGEEGSDFKKEIWIWNKIWRCPVLPRIKIFFWQLCHDALATKRNIGRRIRGVDESCPNCHSRKETCIHITRDCGWVGGIWEGLGLEVMEEMGFERVREWVEMAMRDASEADWTTLMVGCWAIWERRNKVVFEGEKWCEEAVLERVRSMMWEMRDTEQVIGEGLVQIPGQGGEGDKAGWRRPREGEWKINVDAGIKRGVGVGWGAICRDEEGTVRWGVTVQQLGDGDATHLEAEAVLLGLQEAKEAGLKKVIIETDCKLVVDDLKAL